MAIISQSQLFMYYLLAIIGRKKFCFYCLWSSNSHLLPRPHRLPQASAIFEKWQNLVCSTWLYSSSTIPLHRSANNQWESGLVVEFEHTIQRENINCKTIVARFIAKHKHHHDILFIFSCFSYISLRWMISHCTCCLFSILLLASAAAL